MRKTALIVAGGRGARMNTNLPKQFLQLKTLPVLMHTIKQFSEFDKVVVVLPSSEFIYWKSLCKKHVFTNNHVVIAGGENRFESVKNGLKEVDENTAVAIHDGVRPFASKTLINSLFSKLKDGVGVVPVIPITDSIRRQDNVKSRSISRSKLYRVQTPQCFFSKNIKEAYMQKYSDSFTDDASLFESYGGKIVTIPGEKINFKITDQEDLKIAQNLY